MMSRATEQDLSTDIWKTAFLRGRMFMTCLSCTSGQDPSQSRKVLRQASCRELEVDRKVVLICQDLSCLADFSDESSAARLDLDPDVDQIFSSQCSNPADRPIWNSLKSSDSRSSAPVLVSLM